MPGPEKVVADGGMPELPLVTSSRIKAGVDCDAIDLRWEKRCDPWSRHAPA
jgi:hypothetical protein